MTLRAWIHSIVAAFIGGASSAVSAVLVDPTKFNLTAEGLKHLAAVSLVSGAIAVAALLKSSPLPISTVTATTTTSLVAVKSGATQENP